MEQSLQPRLSVVAIIVMICIGSCGRASLPPNAGVATSATCPVIEGPLYFPEGVLPYADFEGSDLRTRQANSAFLERIEEPSLWCGDFTADEEYRFTWDRTWDDPLTIRVSRTGNRYSQHVVIVEGPGGFTPARSSKVTSGVWG
jgi:hypothetical protein